MHCAAGGGDEGTHTHTHTQQHAPIHKTCVNQENTRVHMRIVTPIRMHMNAHECIHTYIEHRGHMVQAQPEDLLKPRASFSDSSGMSS